MRPRVLLLISACAALLAFWVAAAPAPMQRHQEAVALLAVQDDDRARKIIARLEAFQSDEANAGCRLSFGEVDDGRALSVRLRTDGSADAERRLSDLVERCLRDVFPGRERDARVYRNLTEAGPPPGREKGGLWAKRAEMIEKSRQEFAADLRKQEAAVVLQPPRKVRR
jgi:hypothetical protein